MNLILWLKHSDVILFIVIQRQSHTHFELLANSVGFVWERLESGGGGGVSDVRHSMLFNVKTTFVESVVLCKTNKYE